MPWVANNDKERAKSNLRNDVPPCIRELRRQRDEVAQTAGAIDGAVGGSATDTDRTMIDCCKAAMQAIDYAIAELEACRGLVDQLDTRDWVDGDEF